MPKPKVSISKFVKEQVKKWESFYTDEEKKKEASLPVITVSMQPGSGGSLVAQEVAKRLGFDYYHRDIVEEIAESAEIRSTVVNTLEKERLRGMMDFVSSLIEDQYIHPDTYLRHLLEVINAIAKHGRAVIVGRGANFILPADETFSVRVIAPMDIRVRNVAIAYRVPTEEAKKRVIQRESKRKAFVRHSFHADISDPLNYDLTINTGKVSVEAAVEAVIGAVMRIVVGRES